MSASEHSTPGGATANAVVVQRLVRRGWVCDICGGPGANKVHGVIGNRIRAHSACLANLMMAQEAYFDRLGMGDTFREVSGIEQVIARARIERERAANERLQTELWPPNPERSQPPSDQ